MCRICDCRFNVRERISAHDFVEQMREYYGLSNKLPKDRTRKNTRKSILNKIENQLMRIQNEQHKHELEILLNEPKPTIELEFKFQEIMISYYQQNLKL